MARADDLIAEICRQATEMVREAVAEALIPYGQLREEWGVRFPDNQIEIADAEDDARAEAANDAGLVLVRREVTKWRIDETPSCRSCRTTSNLAGDPPLCLNCAVYAPGPFATGGLVSGTMRLPDGDGPASYVLLPQGGPADGFVSALSATTTCAFPSCGHPDHQRDATASPPTTAPGSALSATETADDATVASGTRTDVREAHHVALKTGGIINAPMYAVANGEGRCAACDGAGVTCRRCPGPTHYRADHAPDMAPCRGCNGGSYPARDAGQDAATEAEA
jgi:hypothetical protein